MHLLAQGTPIFWLVRRHHEKERIQEEQHSIRMKDSHLKRPLVCPAYLQEPLHGSHREWALKDEEEQRGTHFCAF